MEDNRKSISSYGLYCCTKFYHTPSSSPPQVEGNGYSSENSKVYQEKKPAGWKAMPFILGNETFERLATFGLVANFTVYLIKKFNLDLVSAANIINIWSGITYFAPLIGAFISDSYVGRFKTIAFASCSSLLGMVIVTLTAWIPKLHPKECNLLQMPIHCEAPSSLQYGVLFTGLALLSVGTGGIRPCSIPFGVDQFDATTEKGVKGINSYYNWYYMSFTVVLMITLTVIVYIQDSVSWVLGFGIPTILMFCSIILFIVGVKIYVYVKPEGSIFSGIAQVFVAAYKKRGVRIPDDVNDKDVEDDVMFYDPPGKESSKLPFTNQFRFLNKAATVTQKEELNPDGTRVNAWRLCSIQQIEELKCIIKCIPIWASGIISFTAMQQQSTFTVSQAMIMNRHLGHFQIPAASIVVVSMITIVIWLPFYDRILVPAVRKIMNHEGGITLLQRIGIGIVFSVMSMVVAGLVERDRRAMAMSKSTMHVMWLAPQLALMGLCEAFNAIGLIEFFNQEFPDHMRSIGNSFFWCAIGLSNYVSSLAITLVSRYSKTDHHPDWLTKDLNKGRLDYFYFLLAGLGVVNFIYFLFCAFKYEYKGTYVTQIDEETSKDIKLDLKNVLN